MKRMFNVGVAATALLAGMAVSGNSFAQEVGAEGAVGMGLPGAAPGGPAGAAQGDSDHDAMIGRIGVGYLGRSQVPLGAAGAVGSTSEDAPIIGIRYWLDSLLGLEAGLGFLNTGGSTTTNNQSQDKAGVTVFAVHGGLPLSLSAGRHFSFQLTPEANVGFATRTTTQGTAPSQTEITDTGLRFDIGARVGGELHFGFIDVPELSIQGSVGALFISDSLKTEVKPPAGSTVTNEDTTTTFSTTVYNDPFKLFTSNIAVLYYF